MGKDVEGSGIEVGLGRDKKKGGKDVGGTISCECNWNCGSY